MTQSMDLNSAIEKRLSQVHVEHSTEWSFWERKTINIHRVVAQWSPGHVVSSAQELRDTVRRKIRCHFKRRWWRGLGFGVVVFVPEIRFSEADCLQLIDRVENSQGTWQFLILVGNEKRRAIACHTWAKGYLSPVYRDMLVLMSQNGFAVSTSVRGGGFVEFIHALHEAPFAVLAANDDRLPPRPKGMSSFE